MPNRHGLESVTTRNHAFIDRSMIHIAGQLDGIVALGASDFNIEEVVKPSVLVVEGIRAADSTVSMSPLVVLGDGRFAPPKIGMVEKASTTVPGRIGVVSYRATVKDIYEDDLEEIRESGDLNPVRWVNGARVIDETPELYKLPDFGKLSRQAIVLQRWAERIQLFSLIAEGFHDAAYDAELNLKLSERL